MNGRPSVIPLSPIRSPQLHSNPTISLNIAAEFVTSAADAAGFPGDRLPEVAFVGRSNVGKSSLLNALARRRLAPAPTRH